MGLSIHYKGRLRDAVLLPELIREVQDIAEIYGWKYYIFNNVIPENQFSSETSFDEVYGINFTPTGSETISITFLSNGIMICPVRIKMFGLSDNGEERSWIYTNSVKTQYAGVATHQLIIHLFRYLNDKYFSDFNMSDESDYWETNDEEKMHQQFNAYNRLMDNFILAFETFPMSGDENMDTYFERLIQYIHKLK